MQHENREPTNSASGKHAISSILRQEENLVYPFHDKLPPGQPPAPYQSRLGGWVVELQCWLVQQRVIVVFVLKVVASRLGLSQREAGGRRLI